MGEDSAISSIRFLLYTWQDDEARFKSTFHELKYHCEPGSMQQPVTTTV